MEALRSIFPSAVLSDSAPQRVPAAVLKGTLRYFNHHDSKWVLCFDACSLYLPSVSAEADGLTVLLLRRGGTARRARLDSGFKYGCTQGPAGTSPYVLAPATEPAAVDCAVGFYSEARSKQRRFRIAAEDCVVVVGGTALRVDALHVEATYQ